MRTASFLLVLTMLLASGCAGTSQDSAGKDASANVVRVDGRGEVAESERGEIVGRVVDDEFRPIEAASVGIQGLDARTKTTQDGIFFFAAVPARAYTLSFDKTGFESKTQSVLVAAQQRAIVEVILVPLANTGSFMDEGFTFRGKISCSVRANASGTNTNPECGQVNAENDNARQRKIDLLPGLAYLLVEVDWRSSLPIANERLTLAIRPVETESWKQVQGARPIRVLLTPDDFSDMEKKYVKSYPRSGGQLQFFMFPGEVASQGGVAVGTTVQQDFTIFATAFYRMEPPADYSRLPT